MTRIRKALSVSNVMAAFAIFLALGGSAFAVQQAKKNSVTSASIKNASVTGKDVKDESLTGTDVTNGSVTADDLAANSVVNNKIAEGAVTGVKLGLSSVDSSKIQDGSVGGPEITDDAVSQADIGIDAVAVDEIQADSVGGSELKGQIAVVGQGVGVSAGTPKTATVKCPGGSHLIAGGYAWQEDEANSMITNAPSEGDPNQTWVVRGMVDAGSNNLFAWANCMAN